MYLKCLFILFHFKTLIDFKNGCVPGSGKKAASRSRGWSHGGSRGGSQIGGRGGATASSLQDQLLYEEEQHIMESLQGQENDSDENEMSCEK